MTANKYEMRGSYMTRAFLRLTQYINYRTTEPKSIIRKNGDYNTATYILRMR